MCKSTDYQRSALERVEQLIQENKLSNEEMVQLIELVGSYLNLKTIPDYAKEYNKSYNGIKNNRIIRTIFNVKFVIDNI